MGQSAHVPQDDGAALPGRDKPEPSPRSGWQAGRHQGHLRQGGRGSRAGAGHRHRPGIPGRHRARAGRNSSIPPNAATPCSPTSSTARAISARRRTRFPTRWKGSIISTCRGSRLSATACWCCSVTATRSWSPRKLSRAVPARVGQAHRGAGGLVRPHRDEHGRGTAGRVRGVRERHVYQEQKIRADTRVRPL